MSARAAALAPALPSRGAWRWGLLALIQLALIVMPLADRLHIQATGQVERLQLAPVDPRDLLRGDYVIVNLSINRLPVDLPGAQDLKRGDRIFVQLRQADGGLKPVAVAGSLEAARAESGGGAGSVLLAGEVRSVTRKTIRADYGIDAFYVPEGQGKVIEKLDTSRMQIEVAIAADGRAVPLQLLVDGKAFKSDGTF